MSFFDELTGKHDNNTELLDFYMNKLMRSLQDCVRYIDAKGENSAKLLVVYNSYDRNIYCIYKSEHEKMQLLINKHISSSQRIPSVKGTFGMEDFPYPTSQVVMEIKKRLSLLGSKNNSVNIVTTPIYGHPNIGLFDKRPDFNRLKVLGSCRTIEIDLFW